MVWTRLGPRREQRPLPCGRRCGPDTATTLRFRDGQTQLSDGPFIETKEFIGGIDVINCAGREQALEIAAAHPLARHHMIEVRPFWSE